jgi:hypothetical protein
MTIQLTRIVMGGGEGIENSSAMEYLDSLAAVAATTYGNGVRDYAIWTSLPEPSSADQSGVGADGVKAVGAVRRKKKAA